MNSLTLPEGVILRNLVEHSDERGVLCELNRAEWTPAGAFLQWNLVRTKGNVLRGVHVHPRHCDYLHVIDGEMLLALHDFRPDDPAKRTTCMIKLSGGDATTAFIPPGVCHGFWFPVPTTYIYGLSTGWSIQEELGCKFDDPAFGFSWPSDDPVLSERDQLPETNYQQMRANWFEMTETGQG